MKMATGETGFGPLSLSTGGKQSDAASPRPCRIHRRFSSQCTALIFLFSLTAHCYMFWPHLNRSARFEATGGKYEFSKDTFGQGNFSVPAECEHHVHSPECELIMCAHQSFTIAARPWTWWGQMIEGVTALPQPSTYDILCQCLLLVYQESCWLY